MRRYAIKLGEVFLSQNRPITDDDRKRAIDELRRRAEGGVIAELSDEAKLTVDCH